MAVIIGRPGVAYECPDHGRFVPTDLPRYEEGHSEAKCMAWLPGGTLYCGKYCPPVVNPHDAMIEAVAQEIETKLNTGHRVFAVNRVSLRDTYEKIRELERQCDDGDRR